MSIPYRYGTTEKCLKERRKMERLKKEDVCQFLIGTVPQEVNLLPA